MSLLAIIDNRDVRPIITDAGAAVTGPLAAQAEAARAAAAASAAAALASETAASDFADLAEVAALTLDNVYPDTTAGLAAVGEGGYFWTANPLKLWRDVAGVAVEQDAPATRAALAATSGATLVAFLSDGTGAASRTVQAVLRDMPLSVKAFGATGDGSTDDYAAIQACFDAAVALKKDVWFPTPAVDYKVGTTVLKSQSFFSPNIVAPTGATINGETITSAATIKIKGGSGEGSASVISGLRFKAGSGTNSTGLEVADQCGVIIQSCRFLTGTYGITAHNEATGGFTEYVQAYDCWFDDPITGKAFRYRVTGGNDSFHGTGMVGCMIEMTDGMDNAVEIGAGSLVYNAPMDFHVWVTGSNKTIIDNSSGLTGLTTKGNITVEVFGAEPYATAPEVINGSGAAITHTGNIISRGTVYLGSKINLVGQRVVLVGPEGDLSEGVTVHRPGAYSREVTLSNSGSGTVIDSIVNQAIVLCGVQIAGPNYDYHHAVIAGTGLSGAGVATVLATTRAFNTSAAGPATFSVDSSGNFKITNTNFTSSYKAFVTFQSLGPAVAVTGSSGADFKPS